MNPIKQTLQKAFNDHFEEFIQDIVNVFPDNVDVVTASKSMTLLRKANPRLIIGIWNKYVSLKYGTRINMRVRVDLQVFPFQQAISGRRLGLFKRRLVTKSEWVLGPIIDSWDQQRGWATEVQTDFKWAKLEVGETPPITKLLYQVVQATKKDGRPEPKLQSKHQSSCKPQRTT